MKALVLDKPGLIEKNPLTVRNIATPEPSAEEIRIKILTCGICHTDLHTVEGELALPKLPLVPGHQVVGIVDSAGSLVRRFKIGDRVGIPWLYSTCSKCRFCKTGKENLCESARFTGYHVDGGFAEYMVVAENFAYPIPKEFTDVHAAPLLCAGIIGYRALCLSDIQPGGRLGLFGFGASAHIAIQVARYWRCEILVFTRSEQHRQLAHQLGAFWTGSAEDKPPTRLDSAIIFAPAGPLVPAALRVLGKGGTLALAGIYMTPIPGLEYELLYHERTVRSVANSTRQDAEEMLQLAGEIPIRTEVTVFPMEEANRALQLLKESRIKGAGVLQVAVSAEA